jgi:hypothetical protein
MSDNLTRLAKAVYGRDEEVKDYIGGPNARILGDATDEIERLKKEVKQAFVDGAKWFEAEKSGWKRPSDQITVEAEAEKRYNERPGAEVTT